MSRERFWIYGDGLGTYTSEVPLSQGNENDRESASSADVRIQTTIEPPQTREKGPEDADNTFGPGIDEDLASPGASVAGEQPLPPCDTTADFCPENGSLASDVRRSSSADDPDP
jgi:hypothetical protein